MVQKSFLLSVYVERSFFWGGGGGGELLTREIVPQYLPAFVKRLGDFSIY